MNETLPINAQIVTADGTWYPVRLSAVPRAGEYIRLWSKLDEGTGHEPHHGFTVLMVEHELSDAPDYDADKGGQTVIIHVGPLPSLDTPKHRLVKKGRKARKASKPKKG
jgi:hypothetical protein